MCKFKCEDILFFQAAWSECCWPVTSINKGHWIPSWLTPSCPWIHLPLLSLLTRVETFRRCAHFGEKSRKPMNSMSESVIQVTLEHNTGVGTVLSVFPLGWSTHAFWLTDFSTVCKVVIKVIDVNNELPLFEKNDVSIWIRTHHFRGLKMILLMYCVSVCSMAASPWQRTLL